ncbi:MAG: M48 family metallopeptidase, partial [Acholeplasmataceae bacterium]|nr:M48 family metallopeptidase [Acholeplasmataceae bacterium]
TINLFLAKIDPSYLLYVLYHEYSHLRVPNHSKEFYLLLSKLFPNYLIIRKELKMIAIN